MVRTVVGDETQVEAQVDSLFLSRRSVQVGLLVGKLGVASSRDSIFALIPAPAKDGEEAAKIAGAANDQKAQKEGGGKKVGKAKSAIDSSSVVIDTDWVAEHARQVSRMLVGGMDVVGVFVFSTESAFRNSSAMLWQAVKAVATASPVRGESSEVSERLLLYISSSPRRVSCRSCAIDVGYSSSGLRPCDWKLGKLLPNLHTLVCSHPVDIRLPVLAKDNGASLKILKDNLFSAVKAEALRLKCAIAVVDGSLPAQDKVLGTRSTTDSPHEIELLLPLNGSGGVNDIRGKQEVAAIVTLSGVVHARAYAAPRESLQRAILDLKEDILSSLKARIDLLCDVSEQAVEDAELREQIEQEDITLKTDPLHLFLPASGGESTKCSLLLPRRVYVSWHDGTFFCDYLLHNETLEDVKERCTELFAVSQSLDSLQIQEPDSAAVLTPSISFSEVISRKKSSSDQDFEIAEEVGKLQGIVPLASLATKSPIPAIVILGAAIALLSAMVVALLVMR